MDTILSLFILTIIVPAIKGQYDTPNDLCGGWFKTTPGSIQYRHLGENATEHVCVWTINPSLPNQFNSYTVTVGSLPGASCNSNTTVVTTNFFGLYKNTSTSEVWNCSSPVTWQGHEATVMIVVMKTTQLITGMGFQLHWESAGPHLNRSGVRTTSYTWGKPSVEPLPYYASGFFKEEVSTHVFPKGNDTAGYSLEIEFQTIDLPSCNATVVPPGGCDDDYYNTNMLLLSIEANGSLNLTNEFTVDDSELPGRKASEWGMVILVWAGEFWGAGGRFQLVYRTVRTD